MRRVRISLLIFFCVLCLSACTTYKMSSDSLKEQLGKIDKQNVRKVYDFRLGILTALARGRQFNNGLTEIQCYDNHNNPTFLYVNPTTQIRITENNGKRQTFYFDTILSIDDSVVVGNKSHFVNIPGHPVTFDSIAKVELQTRY